MARAKRAERAEHTQALAASESPFPWAWILGGAAALGLGYLVYTQFFADDAGADDGTGPNDTPASTVTVDVPLHTAVIFGDSQMEPLGPLLVKGLAAKGIEVRDWVFNRGWSVNDYLTKTAYNSTSNHAGAPNPLATGGISADLVIIQLGTNDAKAKVSQAMLTAQLQQLAGRIRARRVVLVGPAVVNDPSFSVMATSLTSWLPSIAASLGWGFIDSSAFVQSGWYDGIHFNTSVYKSTWAPGILSRLGAVAGVAGLGGYRRGARK
jgi:hypothetical protein